MTQRGSQGKSVGETMNPGSERTRPARTLAVTEEEFEIEYRVFAADVEEYLGRIRDAAKRLKYGLSIRLFVRFVTIKPECARVSSFLRALETENSPSELKAEVVAALPEFHDYLRLVGLYSSKSSLDHARAASRIFRWLGGRRPNRYPLVPRIKWRASNSGDTRKNRSVAVLVQPLEHSEIEAKFGRDFATDVECYRIANGYKSVLGFRKVLAWLIDHYPNGGRSVIESLRSAGRISCDVAAIKDVLDQWDRATTASKAYSPRTLSGEKHAAAKLFEHLGALPDRNYAHFLTTYVKSRYTSIDSDSVADIDFAETKGLEGAARLRKSLAIISLAAFEILADECAIFESLSQARSGMITESTSATKKAALETIKVVMQAELHSLRVTGKSQFSTSGVRTNAAEVDIAVQGLANPAVWYQAGVPEGALGENLLTLQAIRQILSRGIGASRSACLAAKLIIVCDKGWNRQPIESIPAAVFAFRIFDEYGICSASFLQVFKNRAGHDVLALIEHGSAESTGRREKILAAWDSAEAAAEWAEHDERSLLKATDPSFIAIEMLRPLVEALRDCRDVAGAGKLFFRFLSWSGGLSTNDRDVRASFRGGILGTVGVTFPAIRKAVLRLRLRQIGSIGGVRPHAGHIGPNVLLANYFNSPDTIKELWQSTRFFQNAVQALVMDQVGTALNLNVTDEHHNWFLRLANTSGVASAVGFGVSIPISGPRTFRFEPTPDRIRGLISLHVALIIERRSMPRTRWALMGIPLLGFVIAVRRKLKEAGLSTLLRQASRQFMSDFRAGRAVPTRLEPTVSRHYG